MPILTGCLLGTTFSFLNQALDGNGQSFFTDSSLDDQVIEKVTINSTVGMTGINDLQQVRLDPINRDGDGPNAVTELAILALFGLGLLGLSVARRRS